MENKWVQDTGYCNICRGRIFIFNDSNKWQHYKDDIEHSAKYRDPIMNCISYRYTTGWCILSPDGHARHYDGKYNWGGYTDL